ncbi:MAG: CpaF family protein [Pirellulales bacterium]
MGRRIDESSPMVDARLPDGSRVNAVVKPLALDGALVSIRRFASRPSNPGILVENGTISREMLTFLAACVQARLNLIISGGTGSGKTTLLNLLSGFIRDDERVVTIEDAAELQLRQSHVARMETRASNLEGSGEVTARDLLKNALRMRPDRIVVGECRGAEAFDMLQAMNTGHDGSLTTIHANNAHDALDRLEILVGMASMDVPMWFIGRQIASGVQMVVHVARLTGGQRKVVQISEVTGYDGQHLNIQDIFRFEQTGVDERGMAQGSFTATGVVPKALDRFASLGIPLSASLFALPRKTQPPVMPASSTLTTPLSATTVVPVARGQA